MSENNPNGSRTFRPYFIRDRLMVSGMRIAELDGDGRLVFEDRYQPRCIKRGGEQVPVDLLELLDLLLRYYGSEG